MLPLIYLLEDDTSLREVLAEVVREAVCADLETCATVSELRALCDLRTPDLIVADFWGMSHVALDEAEGSEISTLAAIAPLVLVSARDWATRVRPGDFGLVGLLSKPLEIERFVEVVQTALPAARALGRA